MTNLEGLIEMNLEEELSVCGGAESKNIVNKDSGFFNSLEDGLNSLHKEVSEFFSDNGLTPYYFLAAGALLALVNYYVFNHMLLKNGTNTLTSLNNTLTSLKGQAAVSCDSVAESTPKNTFTLQQLANGGLTEDGYNTLVSDYKEFGYDLGKILDGREDLLKAARNLMENAKGKQFGDTWASIIFFTYTFSQVILSKRLEGEKSMVDFNHLTDYASIAMLFAFNFGFMPNRIRAYQERYGGEERANFSVMNIKENSFLWTSFMSLVFGWLPKKIMTTVDDAGSKNPYLMTCLVVMNIFNYVAIQGILAYSDYKKAFSMESSTKIAQGVSYSSLETKSGIDIANDRIDIANDRIEWESRKMYFAANTWAMPVSFMFVNMLSMFVSY